MKEMDISEEHFGELYGEALKAKEIAAQTLERSLQAARNLEEVNRLKAENAALQQNQQQEAPAQSQPTSVRDLMEEHFPDEDDQQPAQQASEPAREPVTQQSTEQSIEELKAEHKAKRTEALKVLVGFGFDEGMCKQFIAAIHKGKVPNIRMDY